MANDEPLDVALGLRVSTTDNQRLDALAKRLPIVSKNSIARVALRMGLALLEEDPTRILAVPTPRRGRKKA